MSEGIQKVVRPALLKIGTRIISTHGWRLSAVEEHLKEHLGLGPSKKWCKVECMAKTMFAGNREQTRADVRRRMRNAFRDLLKRGMFITMEYKTGPGSHGQIIAMKLFEHGSEAEQQFAEKQLRRMKTRHEVSGETFQKALSILGVTGADEDSSG